MKKGLLIIVLLFILMLGGCKKDYYGYWCKYDETATIVILLEDNITDKQKKDIEEKINGYVNLFSLNYYSKEHYGVEDIYANYVVSFNSFDSISTYVDELNKMGGVHEAKQVNAKQNISLYNLEKGGKYTFTDSDEAKEEDIITGKWKLRRGVIIFTPSSINADDILLYTKDGHLCSDADCTKIYFKSDESCNAK